MTKVVENKVVEHKLSAKSLIIFDWDGTLMDSIGLIVTAMHVAAGAQGLTTTDDKVKAIIGLSLMRGIEILFPDITDEQRQTLQADYADYYIANSHKTPFFPDIELMLQTLIAQGKRLAVATGKKRAGLDRVLTASGSRDYFVSTRCADESGSKPDPQMLLDVLQETGHSITDAVFIGDSIHDIQMAKALGMTSIAVNYGAATAAVLSAENPTYQLASPQELIDLLTTTSSITATQ